MSGRSIRVSSLHTTTGFLAVDGAIETSENFGVASNFPEANLHVEGNTYVSSNLEIGQGNLFVDTQMSRIGVVTRDPDATLHIEGNTYVSSNIEIGQANLFVDTISSRIGVVTRDPDATLHVEGNAYVSSNIEIGQANLFVDTETSRVGVVTRDPDAILHVEGNVYASSNIEIGQANLFVDTETSRVGVVTRDPDATLHIEGNAYVSSNLEVGIANLFVDTETSSVGIGTGNPDATLHVDGNVYVSSNLEVGQANLFVDTTSSRVGVGTATPQANLHVDGNVYVSSNLHVDGNVYVSSNLEVSANVRITDGLSNVCELSTFGVPAWDENEYQTLMADDGGVGGSSFGVSVDVDGDYAIVGAPNYTNSDGKIGAAFIFKKDTSTGLWDTRTKIVATTSGNVGFATAFNVGISGDYAIVGAHLDDGNGADAGAAYIFKRDTSTGQWDNGTKITPNPSSAGENFGSRVAISGDYAMVAAYKANAPGSVYFFKRNTSTGQWDQEGAAVRPQGVGQYDAYAYSIAIDGEHAIAGAPFSDNQAVNAGVAYIFKRDMSQNRWDLSIETAFVPITNVETSTQPKFGFAVDISGDYAIIGEPWDHHNSFPDKGQVHIFRRTGEDPNNPNVWDLSYSLSVDGTSRIGYNVAISGDYAVAGTSGSNIIYSFKRIDTNTWDAGTQIQNLRHNSRAYLATDGNNLIMGDSFASVPRAYIHAHVDVVRLSISNPISIRNGTILSFTGQHICFPEGPMNEGLVVSANKNKYVSLNGSLTTGSHAIKSSEALPIVSLSNVANDRSVFGVVDHFEMGGNTRSQKSGIGIITEHKEFGDNRVIVNSLGEGGIWVADTNGNVASGDFMTTSHLPGYAQRQDDDILRNSTVAKSTMDCDFNPLDIPIQKIKKDENGTNILDTYGRLQWEDTDRTEKAYRVRYLTSEGELTDEANAVHTAAFIGCTYHCG